MSGLLQPFDEGILVKKGNAPQGTSVKTEGDPRRQAIYNGGKLAEMLALPVQPVVVLSHPQGSWEADGEEGCRYCILPIFCNISCWNCPDDESREDHPWPRGFRHRSGGGGVEIKAVSITGFSGNEDGVEPTVYTAPQACASACSATPTGRSLAGV